MAVLKRSWAGESVEYQTDGFGGVDADISSTNWIDLATIDLETDGYDLVEGQLRVDFVAAPADDVEFRVVGSSDGVNFDEIGQPAITIGNDTDPHQVTLRAYDRPHVKFQARMSGATDAADVELTVDKARWST